MIGQTSLSSLPKLRDYRSLRISSYDVTGGNGDAWGIEPGEKRVLAEIDGPGCIKHIWMTLGIPSEDYCRRIVLRMYWDGCKEPSVECPIGDFFGLGHGMRKNFITVPVQMSPQNGKGFNSWWPMPFAKKAIIEVENQGEGRYAHYFYIDYELYPRASGKRGQQDVSGFRSDESGGFAQARNPETSAADLAYFHVQWRREADTKGWAFEEGLRHGEGGGIGTDPRVLNKSGKENYVICDAKGDGIYCGAHLDIDCFQRNPNDWYGEGDDMIFIDGEEWPPSLHGTGTEDWYHCAYCPTQEYNAPYHGIILWSGTPEWPWKGKNTVYRYHIEDPLRFRKSILVGIEHGHANKLSNDYSSTAYYYLTKPQRGGPALPPVAERLPRPNEPMYRAKG